MMCQKSCLCLVVCPGNHLSRRPDAPAASCLSKMASVEAQQFAAAAAATLHDTLDAEPPTKRAKLSADGEEELDAQAVAREWKALVEQCAQKLGKKASVAKAYVSQKNLNLQLDALGTQTAARVLQLSRPLSFAIKKQLRKDNVEAEKEVALAIAQAQEELAAGKQRCACTDRLLDSRPRTDRGRCELAARLGNPSTQSRAA